MGLFGVICISQKNPESYDKMTQFVNKILFCRDKIFWNYLHGYEIAQN
jgi:hypothetical protein